MHVWVRACMIHECVYVCMCACMCMHMINWRHAHLCVSPCLCVCTLSTNLFLHTTTEPETMAVKWNTKQTTINAAHNTIKWTPVPLSDLCWWRESRRRWWGWRGPTCYPAKGNCSCAWGLSANEPSRCKAHDQETEGWICSLNTEAMKNNEG